MVKKNNRILTVTCLEMLFTRLIAWYERQKEIVQEPETLEL